MMRYFEQVRIGETTLLGSHQFDAGKIIAFAKRFDWQSFHTDEDAAKRSHFGGLCASGWHTAAIWAKLYANIHAADASAPGANEASDTLGPSPGFQNLTWIKPVFAGDTIRYTSKVKDKRPLASRPQWGLVTSHNEGVNQRGDLAFLFTSHVFVRRKPV